jgi:hypothetical protein
MAQFEWLTGYVHPPIPAPLLSAAGPAWTVKCDSRHIADDAAIGCHSILSEPLAAAARIL